LLSDADSNRSSFPSPIRCLFQWKCLRSAVFFSFASDDKPGVILKVLCIDPKVHEELFKVLPAALYDLIHIEVLEDDAVSCRLRLVKNN
jgi:hypothetical protein